MKQFPVHTLTTTVMITDIIILKSRRPKENSQLRESRTSLNYTNTKSIRVIIMIIMITNKNKAKNITNIDNILKLFAVVTQLKMKYLSNQVQMIVPKL